MKANKVISIQPAGNLFAEFSSNSKTQPVKTEPIHSFIFWQSEDDPLVRITPVFEGDLEEGYVALNDDDERLRIVHQPVIYPKREPGDLDGMLEDSIV